MDLVINELVGSVGSDTLAPMVRQSMGNQALEIADWRVEPLTGGSTTAGLWRYSGTARDHGRSIDWSLILKCLPSPSQSQTDHYMAPRLDPTDVLFWKREYLVYSSGVLKDLPRGFSAPQCFLAEERDGACWLWLEDIGDLSVPEWTMSDFGTAAYHLGQFNGTWAARDAVPLFDWLKTSTARQRAYWTDMGAEQLPAAVATVLWNADMKSVWTDDAVARSQRLLSERELFLHRLDQLPRTFQHQDAGRKNLCIRYAADGTATTWAIDWGLSGISAVGGDLAFLVVASARWFGGVTPHELPELEAIAFDAYLQGVVDAGWRVDPSVARLGYLISSIMMFAPTWVGALANRSDEQRRAIASMFGQRFEDIALRFSEVNLHVLAQADQARALL